jgi:hypothetical protein
MRLPKLDAIYFLTPTVQNVQSLIDDFKDGDKFMYRRAHVYFTSSKFLDFFSIPKLLISLIACKKNRSTRSPSNILSPDFFSQRATPAASPSSSPFSRFAEFFVLSCPSLIFCYGDLFNSQSHSAKLTASLPLLSARPYFF